MGLSPHMSYQHTEARTQLSSLLKPPGVWSTQALVEARQDGPSLATRKQTQKSQSEVIRNKQNIGVLRQVQER